VLDKLHVGLRYDHTQRMTLILNGDNTVCHILWLSLPIGLQWSKCFTID